MNSKMKKAIARDKAAWLNSLPVWQTVTVGPFENPMKLLDALTQKSYHKAIHPVIDKHLRYFTKDDLGFSNQPTETRFVRFVAGDFVGVSEPKHSQIRGVASERGLKPLSFEDACALHLMLPLSTCANAFHHLVMQQELDPVINGWASLGRLVLTKYGMGASPETGAGRLMGKDMVVLKLP